METSSRPLSDSGEFLRMLEAWDAYDRPVHCSNCAHAIVSGDGVYVPDVRCELGHGNPRTMWQLIRRQKPSGFAAAVSCPDFDSMDDDA